MARDFHEVIADFERWHREHPWLSRWYRVTGRLRSASLAVRREPRWALQRIRRGYSDADRWSLDTFIAGVIGNGCRDLREHGHSHPADTTEDEWNAVLERIAGPLLAYSDEKFDDDITYEQEVARYEAAREALHLFAEHLQDMWD